VQELQKEFKHKVEEASALMLNGADMCSRCVGEQVSQLTDKLAKLDLQTRDTVQRSKKEQVGSYS